MRRWPFIALLVSAITGAFAEERIAEVRQGTNLSVTLAPGGQTLVVGLLGQLWTLPLTGGGAVPLTPAGEESRNPRLSPDGSRVVYQRLDGDHWDIWLLDVATGAREPLTSGPGDEREPDFDSDGRSVVFAAERSDSHSIREISIEGRVETELAREGGPVSFPTVSEHGLVAYLLTRGGERSIRVRGLGGAVTTVHTSDRPLSPPSWRPGGGVLVFGEQGAAGSGQLRMLLLGEPKVLKSLSRPEDLFASRPAWISAAEFIYAADGQMWRRGIAIPTRMPIHLFAASVVEAAVAPVDPQPLDAPEPQRANGINGIARSPDGRRAVFTALGDLWLLERGATRRLTDDVFVDLDPVFWPDGESVVFSTERTGRFELWRLWLRDERLTQLTFGALQPRRPAVRPDGERLAYLASTGLEPWAKTVVKVLALPNGTETTVATGVMGDTGLDWSADGRALRVRAATAEPLAMDLRIELLPRELAGESEDATELEPSVDWRPPAPPPDYVVEVGRLFDGVQATYRRHVDVHVRGGRIAAIVGRGVVPHTGPVIDARDATVIPGLIDVHAHQSSAAGERLGRAWLAYGVTTVRELAARPGAALERAEAWASGRSPGPRLLVTAADSATPAPAFPAFPGIAHGFAHSLHRQVVELGVPALDLERYPAAAWVSPTLAPRLELELSPALTAYQDGFSRLIASGTTFVTGLGVLAGLETGGRATRDPAFRALFTTIEQEVWQRPATQAVPLSPLRGTIARLVRAGGRVAVGSEAPAAPVGLGVHLELAELARAGIANDQVLRMATAEGALALGLEQQIGTLEEGKLADFVVVDGDPLTTIEDTLAIVGVAKGGVWVERAGLLEPR